jgi:hypothetical protein
MTLREVVARHGLATVEDSGRWVMVSADVATPQMFGDLHRATDYSLCNALPRERGMAFMLQRNAKPAQEVDRVPHV